MLNNIRSFIDLSLVFVMVLFHFNLHPYMSGYLWWCTRYYTWNTIFRNNMKPIHMHFHSENTYFCFSETGLSESKFRFWGTHGPSCWCEVIENSSKHLFCIFSIFEFVVLYSLVSLLKEIALLYFYTFKGPILFNSKPLHWWANKK